jgi:hypothetical protein
MLYAIRHLRGKIESAFAGPQRKGDIVNRARLRQLAEDRIQDAACLLAGGRWAGAYYLAGYALECGLKACIMVYVKNSGAIFVEKKFSEKCWTHNPEDLLRLAGLETTLNADAAANPALSTNWGVATGWEETSRYKQKTQAEAQAMYDAIANHPNGVLTWIRIRW